MNITLESPNAHFFVKHYQPGKLTLNTGKYQHSVVLYQDKMVVWSPQVLADLDTAAINTLLNFNPGIIILGTGSNHIFPSHQLLSPLYEKRIGVEIMKTEAACQTFNILAHESRDILAALIIQ